MSLAVVDTAHLYSRNAGKHEGHAPDAKGDAGAAGTGIGKTG